MREEGERSERMVEERGKDSRKIGRGRRAEWMMTMGLLAEAACEQLLNPLNEVASEMRI
jgi:hypothetical protein